MRKFLMAVVLATLVSMSIAGAALTGGGPPVDTNGCTPNETFYQGSCQPGSTPITICHVAGLASDPANYVTLHITLAAAVGFPNGHLNENGTFLAGHEQDTIGECNPPPPPTQVTASVSFTDPTCEAGASYTAGPTTGVTYQLTSGTVGPGNTITVTATANAGFVLSGQSVFTHTFAAAPTNCEQEDLPLAAGVTFTEATCTTGPSFQLVKTNLAGIGLRPFYSVEGPLVDGKPVAGASYTITAIPVDGYVFEGQTVWAHTFAAAPTNCGTVTRVCPDGLPPTPGEGAFDPNDDCKRPPTPPPPVNTPPATSTSTPTAAPPAPPAVTPPAVTPKPDNPPAAKRKTAVKKKTTAKVVKKTTPKLTGDPKKDECKALGNGLARCKGVVVVQGMG